MKRFTETEKWRDPWFRKLRPFSKCLWQYICDQCDHSGVLDPDWELMSLQIGEPVGQEDLQAFGERIQILPEGKIWIVKFIEFQYGQLSESCPAHRPVFRAIEQNGLNVENTHSDRVSNRVSNTLQDKDKDKDKEGGVSKGEDFPPDDLLTKPEALAQVGMAGIPQDFSSYIYDDWHCRGGKDAGGVKVPWVRYAKKRWTREERDWRAGSHNGKAKTNGNGKHPQKITDATSADDLAAKLGGTYRL
jgi:hypothetical protein